MRYRFGVFEFDPSTHQLTRQGLRVPLEAQPARALHLLLSRRGELVGKDDLRLAIWPGQTHVDFDRGIAYCLSEVRSALGDSGTNPRFIQTIPRAGYRFIAPIAVVQPFQRRYLWAATAAAVATAVTLYQLPSRPIVLAVSIFDNETGLPELDSWVATLSDLVVADLATLKPDRLSIIGNASQLRQPRNIRRIDLLRKDLSADHLILGQLQRQDSGLRFITHLIRLSDGVHLKANRISWPSQTTADLDAKIMAEFRHAVMKHLLHTPEDTPQHPAIKTT